MMTRGVLSQYSLNDFRKVLGQSKNLIVITGAGVSADSGVPTFRDSGGLWRGKFEISRFATPQSFKEDPASVWEFYHYRRELVQKCQPNKAHYAIANCERWFEERGLQFTLITQNVDGLHKRAGSRNIIEIHGSLFETKCTKCLDIEENFDSPICKALTGTEELFKATFKKSDLPVEKLPHCKKCGGLLRPNVVWYNEELNATNSKKAWNLLDQTDLAVIIGTSSVVYPVAMYGSKVCERGVPVAEFNVTKGPYTDCYRYYFEGKASDTVPKAFDKNFEEWSSESGSS